MNDPSLFGDEILPPPPITWPEKLFHFRGSPDLLAGISVWHDFEWRSKFTHNRRAFPKGKRLSHFVKAHCPEGKKPHLVLTKLEEFSQVRHESEHDFSIVVNIDKYLTNSEADAAITFFARELGDSVTSFTEHRNIIQKTGGISALANAINPETISTWLQTDTKKFGELVDIIGTFDGTLKKDQLERIFRLIEKSGKESVVGLLEWATGHDLPLVLESLSRLNIGSLQSLNSLAGVASLKHVMSLWDSNKTNAVEEFWQKGLTKNVFVLSQVFSYPVILLKGKAYVGGKGIKKHWRKSSRFPF